MDKLEQKREPECDGKREQPRRLIIDTDPGIDDAMAILLAASAEDRLQIEALTTVNGNADIENVTLNAFTILDLCKKKAGAKEILVYQGAKDPLERDAPQCESSHGNDGLGNVRAERSKGRLQNEAAEDYLIRAARENPGELTLMPIGPLTNIALAVKKDPAFVSNIRDVVIMGGAEFGGNMSPVGEFNFWHDPEAAEIVFQAGFHSIVMIGLDVTRKVFMTPAMREYLYQLDTPVSRFIHQITRAYVDSHWKKQKNLGCELCDVLTAAYLIDESILTLKDAYVEVMTQEVVRGMSVVYRCESWKDQLKNCRVAVDVDSKRFFQIFFERLFPGHAADTKRILDEEFR